MRFREKTVTGIDIAEDRISIVVLTNGEKGPHLVKSDVMPMPEGAVKDGNIEDAKLLSKALRELKVRNRIWSKRAAVSLFAKPVVIQMIDMPKQVPSNMGQFVRNEVKHCVALPSGDVVIDFCGIGLSRRGGDKKILAVSAETEKLTRLVNVLSRAGFSVELVEPTILSYIRAIGSERTTFKAAFNVLLVILRQTTLTLCVLRNGVIDFVRTKEASRNLAKKTDLYSWLADETGEIQKYYSCEVADSPDKWEITVFTDSEQTTRPVEEFLRPKMTAEKFQVRTAEDAFMDTPVPVPADSQRPSPVAIGLAMKLISVKQDAVKLNLLPQRMMRIREIKRDVLVAANALAVLMLIMVVVVGGPAWLAEKISGTIAEKRLQISGGDTQEKLEQHRQLDERLKALAGRLNRIAQISVSHHDVNWVGVLYDIGKATPRSVRITSLSCPNGTKIEIAGLALSNEAIYLFVESLEKIQNISSVALLKAEEQGTKRGLMTYQLSCELGVEDGKKNSIS